MRAQFYSLYGEAYNKVKSGGTTMGGFKIPFWEHTVSKIIKCQPSVKWMHIFKMEGKSTAQGHPSLLHAIKNWLNAITINLWPYTIRYANDFNNNKVQGLCDGRTRHLLWWAESSNSWSKNSSSQGIAKEEQIHIVFESLFTPSENDLFDQHPLIGMKSIMGPDTLYLWEARKTERLSKILRGHSKGNQWLHRRRVLEDCA